MKKIMILLITLTTLTNVSYASFPLPVQPVISIDTIIPDTNKIVINETTSEFHSRMQKEGFDISSCMCVDCRNGISPLTKNIKSKEVLKKNKMNIWIRLLIIMTILSILLIILLFRWMESFNNSGGIGVG